MTRRTKLTLAVFALCAVLGLAAATNAWFVTVVTTKPGTVSSGLIRWYPESGAQTIPSILTYGNLASGGIVDTDGVAIVLPDESLLPTVKDGSIRTSWARAYQEGESADSIIHSEQKDCGDSGLVTQTQRDLVDKKDESYWCTALDNAPITTPDPLPNAATHRISTDTTTTETPGGDKTVTVVTVTTTYTPIDPKIHSLYYYIHRTTTTVTHEGAKRTPDVTDAVWGGGTTVYSADETVLYTDDTSVKPTRSYLAIKKNAAVTGDTIPLSLGNVSTVDTQVRMGLNAILSTPAAGDTQAKVEALSFYQHGDGTWFLGKYATENGTEIFIPMLEFQPATTATYGWGEVTDETAADATRVWKLWDLTLSSTEGDTTTKTTTVPFVPGAETPATVMPVYYQAVQKFKVVLTPPTTPTIPGLTDDIFNTYYNSFYCSSNPTVTIHLNYYVRQDQYMDWTQFYSKDFVINVKQEVTS